MTRDPHEELADRLFAAARRERASASVRDETLRALGTPPVSRDREGWYESRRLLIVGLALAACIVAALGGWWRRAPDAPQIAAETARGPAPSRQATLPLTPAEEHFSPSSTERATLPVPVPSSVPRAKPIAGARPTLERELELLDRARKEATAGDASAALAVLDDYEKLGKHGSLMAEARLLRIQVLAKAGDSARAAALAARFISDYPDSPLTDRARRFLPRDHEDSSSQVPKGAGP